MRIQKLSSALRFIFLILLSQCIRSTRSIDREKIARVQRGVKPFLGRWDLTLKAPDREYPSWIEIQQDNGELKAQFVSRWGNARPLPEITITNGHLKICFAQSGGRS